MTASGPESPWSDLALTARPQLVSVARRVVRDRDEAEDVVDEGNSFLAPAEGFSFSESAGWLEPTLYVAGAEHEAPEESEDDWLKRG